MGGVARTVAREGAEMDSEGGFWKSAEVAQRRRGWQGAVLEFMRETQQMAAWINEHAGPPIGIFGSARGPKQIPKVYHKYADQAGRIGQVLGEQGYSLVTGGCPGMPALVEASFRKHRIVPQHQPIIGIRIDLGVEFEAREHDSNGADMMLRTGSFGTRTELMEMATDGGIFLPGGVGTELELYVFSQLEQLREHTRRGGPIILVGREFWTPVLDRMDQLKNWGTVGRGELRYHLVNRTREIIPILEAFNSNAAGSARIRDMAEDARRRRAS